MLPTAGGCSRWASLKPVPTANSVPSGSTTASAPSRPLCRPVTRQVPNDAGFGVVEPFGLQESCRAAGFVPGARLPEHEPLATQRFDPVEFFLQMFGAAASHLGQNARIAKTKP